MAPHAPVGERLRNWRRHRRLTQMELAGRAGISARHMSFLETGRSLPSRTVLLRLGALLDVPLRERNRLMVAAGYAPMYRERGFDDADMAVARDAVQRLLVAHEPFPALAVDRHWQLVAANRALPLLLAGVDEGLLQAPANVLRLSLHPAGLAPRIANLGEWRAHVFERLEQQIASTGDPALVALLAELRALPGDDGTDRVDVGAAASLVVPLRLRDGAGGELAFVSTTTVFGTPRDVILSELAIESFFPADPHTARTMRRLLDDAPPH